MGRRQGCHLPGQVSVTTGPGAVLRRRSEGDELTMMFDFELMQRMYLALARRSRPTQQRSQFANCAAAAVDRTAHREPASELFAALDPGNKTLRPQAAAAATPILGRGRGSDGLLPAVHTGTPCCSTARR